MTVRRSRRALVMPVMLVVAAGIAIELTLAASLLARDSARGAAAPDRAARPADVDRTAALRVPRPSDPVGRRAVRPPRAVASLEPRDVLASSWTVEYVVGRENGDGVNVSIPLGRLDGMVIGPGEVFEFWSAIGEVSRRVGYRDGALVRGNTIDPDGAIAGGICIVSTAVFNAAARAGFEILMRRPHGVYLDKYPLGLDSAVAKGGGIHQTIAFRNDTDHAVTIRTFGTDLVPGATATARIDIYSPVDLGRVVDMAEPVVSQRRDAPDIVVPTTALESGVRRRSRKGAPGMTVVVERFVRDASGSLVHHDRWTSRYRPLYGLVKEGVG